MGIRYSAVPGHTTEMADALNEELSAKWTKLRGLKIVSFGISSLTAPEEDEKRIKDLQTAATMRNPAMAAGALTAAQADAMRAAASNGTGPAMAFMGMGMANNAGGMNAQQLLRHGTAERPERTAESLSGSGKRRLWRGSGRPARRHRRVHRKATAGPAPSAEPSTPASSAPTAARQNRQRRQAVSARTAARSMIPPIRRSSARTAARSFLKLLTQLSSII
jgi:hypothetical protein